MAQKKNAKGNTKKDAKPQSASKNGKKAEGGGGSSFFTWFMVLALLGVWTSVAVVWFELVDYDDVNWEPMMLMVTETLMWRMLKYC
ncbi:hypothetical protein JZ751_003992 [Albula glossodonta]|uniref:Aspartyl beta-hydroxylase/Triadin domain-containing protein n=1 Tax=Albula glossodonta TaxID=121402 RepID=A0A8T2P3G0_9TELE|nr:hypothetical protein JZ751_003992 [Albula glossodonta]